jgi:hypothetical protein
MSETMNSDPNPNPTPLSDDPGALPQALRDELARLSSFPGGAPADVDAAILGRARARFVRRRRFVRLRRVFHGAAAAALVLFAAWAYRAGRELPAPAGELFEEGGAPPRVAGDFDGNGRTDIVDALHLARSLERGEPLDSEWDLDGDGAVDRTDVDALAFSVVKLQ